MTEQEWRDRYIKRIAVQTGWPEQEAREFVDSSGLSHAELSESFESDPEAAADEEMSCWEPEEDVDAGTSL